MTPKMPRKSACMLPRIMMVFQNDSNILVDSDVSNSFMLCRNSYIFCVVSSFIFVMSCFVARLSSRMLEMISAFILACTSARLGSIPASFKLVLYDSVSKATYGFIGIGV